MQDIRLIDTFKPLLISVISLFSLGACAVFSPPQTSAEQDRAAEMQLEGDYAASEYLAPYQLDADVSSGVAYIAGKVNVRAERQLALEMARGTSGIYKIEDRIVVVSEQTGEERGFATVVDDASITTAVKSRLLLNSDVHGWRINVDTLAGRVTLNGHVFSKTERALAEELTRNTRGVQAVINNLEIRSKM